MQLVPDDECRKYPHHGDCYAYSRLRAVYIELFMTPGYHASIIGSSLRQIYEAATNTGDNPICILAGQCEIDAALVGWSFLIMIYSFTLLGGTFFRKQPIILTAVSGIIIFMIIGYCGSKLEDWGVSISTPILTMIIRALLSASPSSGRSFSLLWQPSASGHPISSSPACR